MKSKIKVSQFATKRAFLLFFLAYVVVNILATGISVVYSVVNHSPQPQDLGVGLLQAPAFVATVPYQVLIMYIVWPLFVWLYFRNRTINTSEIKRLAWFWLVSAILADFVFFVLPKAIISADAYAFTPYEFYVEYQPWITLIYLAIFLSPWIYKGVAGLIKKDI